MQSTKMNVIRARTETPGCKDVIHLNNAGAALMPEPVVQSLIHYTQLEAKMGGYEAAEQEAEKLKQTYSASARFRGVYKVKENKTEFRKLYLIFIVFLFCNISNSIAASNDAIEALKEAHDSGFYNVRVLRNKACQTVYMLGERHVKVERESLLGRKVIDHFDAIGLEGALFSKGDYLGMGMTLAATALFTGNLSQISQELNEQASRDRSPALRDEQRSYPSLIQNVVNLLQVNQLFGSKRNLDVRWIESPLSSKIGKSLDNAYTALKVCAGLLGTSAINVFLNDYTSSTVDACIYGATATAAVLLPAYLNQKLNPLLPSCMAIESIPNSFKKLDEERDPVMAIGIKSFFNGRPDLKDLLVIVGQEHIPGITEILVTAPNDWAEISFEEARKAC